MYVADRSISGYLHVSLWSVYRSRLVSHGSPVVKSEEPEVYTVYINNREQITIRKPIECAVRRPAAEWWKGVVGDDGGTSPLDLGHFT